MALRQEAKFAQVKGKQLIEAKPYVVSRKARGFANCTFLSLEEEKHFLEDFSDRKISPGKNIDFYDSKGLGLEQIFSKMEWLPLLSLCTPAYTTLV